GWRLGALVLGLGMAIFLVAIDTTIVSTAIPSISQEFGSVSSDGWYGSAFFLTNAATQAPWGTIYELTRLKPSFLVAMTLFEAGSLICALAHNSATLTAGRAVAGLGAAGVSSGAYTILAIAAPPRWRSVLTAVFGISYAVASFVGPAIGGILTSSSTWRWCFWINLPIGGVTMATVAVVWRPTTTAHSLAHSAAPWKTIGTRLDLPGIILFTGSLTCYLLALEWGGAAKPWHDAGVVGTLVTSGVLGLLFLVQQWRAKENAAVLPFPLFRRYRRMALHCGVIFFLAAGFFVLLYNLPLYFQAVRNLSATASGLRTVPLVLGCGLFSALSGWYMSMDVAVGWIPMLLGAVLTTAGAGPLWTLTPSTPVATWAGLQVLVGAGVGIACQIPIILNQAMVVKDDPANLSVATAVTLFFQLLGGCVFLQLAQCLLTNEVAAHLHQGSRKVDLAAVLEAGAAGLAQRFDGDTLSIVAGAYMQGIKATVLLSTTLAGLATIFA
ncbi:MDR family MFS transporter, partial [Aspergillus saccharolyticus JOP 1030-1]